MRLSDPTIAPLFSGVGGHQCDFIDFAMLELRWDD